MVARPLAVAIGLHAVVFCCAGVVLSKANRSEPEIGWESVHILALAPTEPRPPELPPIVIPAPRVPDTPPPAREIPEPVLPDLVRGPASPCDWFAVPSDEASRLPAAAPPSQGLPDVPEAPEFDPTARLPMPNAASAAPAPKAAARPGAFVEASNEGMHNAPPEYPEKALRAGMEGTVLVALQLDAAGRVLKAWVLESSGFDLLDSAALLQLQKWQFKPATRDGVPVVSTFRQPVVYRIRR